MVRNPTLRWLPSQNGLFCDAPHLQSATLVSSLSSLRSWPKIRILPRTNSGPLGRSCTVVSSGTGSCGPPSRRRKCSAPVGQCLVFACAINTATYGAAREDAGVASAMVNTNQQVGGSIGIALLNTIAASAFSSYLLTHGQSPAAQAGAAVHSYIVAFWVSAGIFAGAAIVCGLVLPPGLLAPAAPEVALATA